MIPIFIAFTIVFLTYPLIKNYFNAKVITETVHGNQTKLRGWYDNLNGSTDAELQYIASIKNKNQLTLFGSSEFSDSSTVPFNFFPDSLGQQSIGLGHAYHQELSILIELLAAHKYNIESKICIFLSPGWFSSEGTNIQSFIEFARPNFLKNIINNDSISLKYKKHIGQFIDKYSGDIENMDQVMENFVFISKTDSMNYFKQFLRNYFGTIKTTNNVDYLIYQNKIKTHTWDGDFNITGHNLQNQFINSITTNKMYVYDDYYKKNIIDKNGNEKFSILEPIDFQKNNEYGDFKLLVEYIKERKINASFVIIPFNPYYYKNTEVYKPLIDSITQKLIQNDIPYYNMYVYDKSSYEPGILKDIMHLGNYGWMKINQYLYNLYVKHEK